MTPPLIRRFKRPFDDVALVVLGLHTGFRNGAAAHGTRAAHPCQVRLIQGDASSRGPCSRLQDSEPSTAPQFTGRSTPYRHCVLWCIRVRWDDPSPLDRVRRAAGRCLSHRLRRVTESANTGRFAMIPQFFANSGTSLQIESTGGFDKVQTL